jgi:hypothetical protein
MTSIGCSSLFHTGIKAFYMYKLGLSKVVDYFIIKFSTVTLPSFMVSVPLTVVKPGLDE